MFYINSDLPARRIKDGLSNTVAFSESVLGRAIPRLTPREDADPRYVYVFAKSAPLTLESCHGSAFWNYTELRGFAWVNGEYRCGLYNHYWTPNSVEFDCVSSRITGPPSVLYTAYGWRCPQPAPRRSQCRAAGRLGALCQRRHRSAPLASDGHTRRRRLTVGQAVHDGVGCQDAWGVSGRRSLPYGGDWVIVKRWLAETFSSTVTPPPSQWTSSRSTCVRWPRPKCSRVP